MGIFGIKGGFLGGAKNSSVGVDVGSRSIKIVELEKKGDGLYLKNYAIITSKDELVKAGSVGVISGVTSEIIGRVFDEIGIKDTQVNVSVPSFASLITTIEVPKLPREEIEQVIQVEAPKYIPVRLDDVVYGWQIVDEGELMSLADDGKEAVKVEIGKESADQKVDQKNEEKISLLTKDKRKEELKKNRDLSGASLETVKVLVVAIMKEISNQYEKVFRESELEIDSLEIDSFSLTRALIGNDQGCYMIVDMGRKVTNILIVAKKNILINRTIDVAGDRITATIAQSLNIDGERAEKIKSEKGVMAVSQMKGDVGSLAPVLGIIISEIKRTISIFSQSYKNFKINEIVLSGGATKLVGLDEYISKEIKLDVINGNPLSNIKYPKEIAEKVLSESSILAIAIGLAMLGFEEKNSNEDESVTQ